MRIPNDRFWPPRDRWLALEQHLALALRCASTGECDWRALSEGAADLAQDLAGQALGQDRAGALRLNRLAGLVRAAARAEAGAAPSLLTRARESLRTAREGRDPSPSEG